MKTGHEYEFVSGKYVFAPGSLWGIYISKAPFNDTPPLLLHYHVHDHLEYTKVGAGEQQEYNSGMFDMDYMGKHTYVYDPKTAACSKCGDNCPMYVIRFYIEWKLMETPCAI